MILFVFCVSSDADVIVYEKALSDDVFEAVRATEGNINAKFLIIELSRLNRIFKKYA